MAANTIESNSQFGRKRRNNIIEELAHLVAHNSTPGNQKAVQSNIKKAYQAVLGVNQTIARSQGSDDLTI
ncbi:hypothetical protein [Agarivorans sp. QJM3NY_33]|uniref:hypothetical protein n=1 Tax=Agarivorans sp. QJM3NY_33 TaxID=3421432 RepID=UPI003D7EE536